MRSIEKSKMYFYIIWCLHDAFRAWFNLGPPTLIIDSFVDEHVYVDDSIYNTKIDFWGRVYHYFSHLSLS